MEYYQRVLGTATPGTYLLFRHSTWRGEWSYSNGRAVHDEIHVGRSSGLKSLFKRHDMMAGQQADEKHRARTKSGMFVVLLSDSWQDHLPSRFQVIWFID